MAWNTSTPWPRSCVVGHTDPEKEFKMLQRNARSKFVFPFLKLFFFYNIKRAVNANRTRVDRTPVVYFDRKAIGDVSIASFLNRVAAMLHEVGFLSSEV